MGDRIEVTCSDKRDTELIPKKTRFLQSLPWFFPTLIGAIVSVAGGLQYRAIKKYDYSFKYCEATLIDVAKEIKIIQQTELDRIVRSLSNTKKISKSAIPELAAIDLKVHGGFARLKKYTEKSIPSLFDLIKVIEKETISSPKPTLLGIGRSPILKLQVDKLTTLKECVDKVEAILSDD